MTREEAIEILENGVWWDLLIPVTTIEGRKSDIELHEALDIALAALRPITREQVEKVWRGCEKCSGAGEYSRYAENLTKILLAKYCPHCGRPLTDEAMQMVMERMEKLYEQTSN